MRSSCFGLGFLAAIAHAQFEPVDFNATEALIKNGVDVTAIPALAGLAERSALSGCSAACTALAAIYGNTSVAAEGTIDYDNFHSRYWSAQQGAVSPHCVYKPGSTRDVSTLVLISRLTQCPFAVKGGGHAAFAGASSIEGGITVSLERLNRVEVNSNKKYVNVGPGNRWVDVYNGIEKSGVGVIGGRMAPVGVPGLVLGGGISFFSNKRGWACDNIASYELVTASGVVINVDQTSYPDLYWALRGGSGNFGIVTNFKMDAFPLGQMWGGQRIYTENSIPAVLDAIYKFSTTGSSADTDAAQIVSISNIPQLGNIAIVQMHYAQPTSNASTFDSLNAIPSIVDNTGLGSLGDMAVKMNEGQVDGRRQSYWDVTFKVDRELFTFLTESFFARLSDLAAVDGVFPVISIQAITEGQLKGMQKNGGNALGLDPTHGPYFIMNMGLAWNEASDDATVMKFAATVIKLVKAEARAKGLDNDYIYLNYASQYQDPIISYGAANVRKLGAVSEKYDPTGVFQKLSPGGFKVAGGAPNPNGP